MRVSEEAMRVDVARSQLASDILRLVNEYVPGKLEVRRYDLTPVEVLQALTDVQANILKVEARRERSG